MNHQDYVRLLRAGVPAPGGVWADLGSGEGAFTLALRELVGPDAEIYSVERDRRRLERQEAEFRARAPDSRVRFVCADFTRPLDLPPLDGIVMANALHFYRDKEPLLIHIREYLRPGGALLLVEYNVDRGNPWVPHPVSFETLRELLPRAGFAQPQLIATAPSSFLREMYAARAEKDPPRLWPGDV